MRLRGAEGKCATEQVSVSVNSLGARMFHENAAEEFNVCNSYYDAVWRQ